jgi:hypothetical protein
MVSQKLHSFCDTIQPKQSESPTKPPRKAVGAVRKVPPGGSGCLFWLQLSVSEFRKTDGGMILKSAVEVYRKERKERKEDGVSED